MLQLAYLISVSRRLSLRRLGVVFLIALFLASFVVHGLPPGGMNLAVCIAMGITAVLWVLPVVTLVFGIIQGDSQASRALDEVSGPVIWSYGFAIVLLADMLVHALLFAPAPLTVGRLGIDAGAGYGLLLVWRALRRSRPLA